MAPFDNPLSNVSVASPCKASWDDMEGDDRARFCGSCAKHVYNLSGMTEREATDLISERQGRVCVRFFRRRDGTILTADCPRGLRAVGRRAARAAIFLAGMIGLGAGAVAAEQSCSREGSWAERIPPVAWLIGPSPVTDPGFDGSMVMGKMTWTPPPAPPGSSPSTP